MLNGHSWTEDVTGLDPGYGRTGYWAISLRPQTSSRSDRQGAEGFVGLAKGWMAYVSLCEHFFNQVTQPIAIILAARAPWCFVVLGLGHCEKQITLV